MHEPLELNWLQQHKANISDKSFLLAIDEVGRGPVFGPVTIGGVLIKLKDLETLAGIEIYHKIKDSKKLSAKRREQLLSEIKPLFYTATSHVSVNYIDRYNINRAIEYGVYRITQRAKNFLQPSGETVDIIFLDGNYRFSYPKINMKKLMPQIETIVKGDERTFSIACASIVAKVTRDQMITRSAQRFFQYHLEKNAGYGTREHIAAIKKYGLTRFHRKSYLKKYL